MADRLTGKFQPGLLDVLAGRMGCLYLSDLKRLARREDLEAAVEGITADAYSVLEWRDAYDHLFSEAPPDSDQASELKTLLLARLCASAPAVSG